MTIYEKKANKLINEQSPYLLQHAYNPVDWYPWGEEAFEKATKENKPIFLSIGYSTCHWCHVMSHESFENAEVAAYLNEDYVSIKVDREERPDVDSIYMKVCQMMTGQGGWPLTIFMTPEKIPFYAGTYFPKYGKYNLPGLMDALPQLQEKFHQDPKHIKKITNSVKQALAKSQQTKSAHRLTDKHIHEAFRQLVAMYDQINGGFGGAPKFPQPQNLLFLLSYYYHTEQPRALEIVEITLQKMAAGGIYDHIGFGFCRYATDEKWLVPHFEKMLYDNALLLMVYTQCYQITGKSYYKDIAEQIIHFISREIKDENGGFYTAIDADSEGVEGKYYLWNYDEIFDILDVDLATLFTKAYHITPQGNFEGSNIPNSIQTDIQAIAAKNHLTLQALEEKLETARQLLLKARNKRIRPHTDDKILTSNNALMIAALAKAGSVLDNPSALEMAENAMMFIEKNMYQNGRLMARYRNGETKYPAYLDDYAFLSWAYLELYHASLSLKTLKQGKNVLDEMTALFWDQENGGFYFTGRDAEQLISADKEVYDGALPSGNSVAAFVLANMGHLTGDSRYLDQLDDMMYTFFDDISQRAANAAFFMLAALPITYPTREVVVIASPSDSDYQAFIHRLQSCFLPNISLLSAATPSDFHNVSVFAAEYKQIDDKPTIYICENFSCHQPMTDFDKAWDLIVSRSRTN